MRVNTVLPGTPPTVSVPRLIGTWESMAVEVLDSCTELIPPVATLGDVIPSRATTHIDTHISVENTIMATVGNFGFSGTFSNSSFSMEVAAWRLCSGGDTDVQVQQVCDDVGSRMCALDLECPTCGNQTPSSSKDHANLNRAGSLSKSDANLNRAGKSEEAMKLLGISDFDDTGIISDIETKGSWVTPEIKCLTGLSSNDVRALETTIADGHYLRATSMIGWKEFYGLDDGPNDISDIQHSSLGIRRWSQFYEERCQEEDRDIDIIYETALEHGLVDESGMLSRDSEASTDPAIALAEWNQAAAFIIISMDDDLLASHSGTTEELSPLPVHVDPVDKLQRQATSSRATGAKRMRLKRGITMDSGAAAKVMPRRMARYPSKIRPSPGSIAGVKYVACNDAVIPNEGEYDFGFNTSEGHSEVVVMQIAAVNKALGSAAYFVDNKYLVVFDQDAVTGKDISGMIHKPTGRMSKFRREKNIWILDAFVNSDPGFARQGAR